MVWQQIHDRSAATRWFKHDGDILHHGFCHSGALACRVGLYPTMRARVWPITLTVVS